MFMGAVAAVCRRLLLTACLLCLGPGVGHATEIVIPALSVASGQEVTVPITIDAVDNLAGLKLVLTYDTDLLTYLSGKRTSHTASLMHIVNDRKPGVLIVVMAGARGIRGTDVPLFVARFRAADGLTGETRTRLRITEIQLMSDTLKEFDAAIRSEPLVIRGEAAAAAAP